jgi:hypothetical protein
MGLEFAIEELYASGWSTLDSSGCEHHADGRLYPKVGRIRRFFQDQGYTLAIAHVEPFDCYRAAWVDQSGSIGGSVVGNSEIEAAVFAMAHLRRHLVLNAGAAAMVGA